MSGAVFTEMPLSVTGAGGAAFTVMAAGVLSTPAAMSRLLSSTALIISAAVPTVMEEEPLLPAFATNTIVTRTVPAGMVKGSPTIFRAAIVTFPMVLDVAGSDVEELASVIVAGTMDFTWK